jgi:hypothetical protein
MMRESYHAICPAACRRRPSKNSPDDEGIVIIGSKTLKKYNSSSVTVIGGLELPQAHVHELLYDLVTDYPLPRTDSTRDQFLGYSSFAGIDRIERIDENIGIEEVFIAHSSRRA